jgi:hypothetical protein
MIVGAVGHRPSFRACRAEVDQVIGVIFTAFVLHGYSPLEDAMAMTSVE